MNFGTSVNWWAIWVKRLILIELIGLLCFVGGHGALLIFGLTWDFEPFRVAVFGIGCAVHAGAVVALSEAKRIRSGGLVALAVFGLLVGAVLDGRFAAEHILSAESGAVEATAAVDALRGEAAPLEAEIQAKEAAIAALRSETARMDHDGDGSNDGQVKANREVLVQLSEALTGPKDILEEKRRMIRAAAVQAAAADHARSVSLKLTDGLDDRRKIFVFWGAGSVVMLLMSGIIAAGTWVCGIMSAPETLPLPMPTPTPAGAPPGGQPAGLAETEAEAHAPDETGLGFRKDKSRTPVWNRRVNGQPVYLRLPAGLQLEELRRVVDCLNRVADAAESVDEGPRLRLVK